MPILSNAMKQMDSNGIANDVSSFEKIFEDMEVKTAEMDGALNTVYASSLDQSAVTNLLAEM